MMMSNRSKNIVAAAVSSSVGGSGGNGGGMTTAVAVKTILGTMTFGGQTSEPDATTMIEEFVDKMIANSTTSTTTTTTTNVEIDSAIMYQNGKTEQIIGRILRKQQQLRDKEEDKDTREALNICVASKANPFTKDKNLSPNGLSQQLEASLKSLQMQDTGIDLYYLHAPDIQHNIEPTLEQIQILYQQGKFQRFGLSNFTAWETTYIYHYMYTRNYILPSVYQGMYNAISRHVETELFPALRKLNMSFYAYNPLAAGMLTGKYKYNHNHNDDDNDVKLSDLSKLNATVGTRFAGKSFWSQRYRERYQQKEQFQAVDHIQSTIERYNHDVEANGDDDRCTRISMTDASLRWLKYHSYLDGKYGDGIILGASTIDHFRTNLMALQPPQVTSSSGGKLPHDIVVSFDEAWKLCQHVSPDYSRGYSGSAVVVRSPKNN